MKIALIGATGFVGSALLDELLARGHQVHALTRQPGRISPRSAMTAIQADVQHADQVQQAITGCDAVVSAFNAGWDNPEIYRDYLNGSRAIVQAIRAAGIGRYLVVGGACSLFLPDGRQIVDAPDFPPAIRDGARAARDVLTELQATADLDWSMLSPPISFHPGVPITRTCQYRLGADAPLMADDGSPGSISAADLAVALADELEQPRHHRQRFTVAW